MALPLQVILLAAAFLSLISLTGNARDCNLVLEWEQHWPTYGVGGTCNFGTHNFFIGDVDADGVIELITGGLTYNKPNYTAEELEAPLRIWNWDGENFTLEASYNWAGILRSIYATDLDGDGLFEIITGGTVRNKTGSFNSIKVWSWDNKDLILRSSFEAISARSIFVSDIDNDGNPEILTAGAVVRDNTTFARLCILSWSENQLFLVKSFEWCTEWSASANSVYAYDLDKDGIVEIITGGYDNGLTNSSGQLRIWQWKGDELFLKANQEWRLIEGKYGVTVTGAPMGNTLVENVKVGDVDGDGVAEIVTGGFAYDGQKMNAQLGIWKWDGSILVREKSHEWFIQDITEIKAVALSDVDGDGGIEIMASGGTAVYGGFQNGTTPEAAFLTIWNWDGQTLRLKCEEYWTIGEGVFAWNVGTGDIDGDGIVEIVTVGCMYVNQLCDPDLRIWSLQVSSDTLAAHQNLMVIVFVAAITVVVLSAVYIFLRRKKK